MNKFTIYLGDWSCDGHGRSSEHIIETDLELIDAQKAYLKTCKKINVYLHRPDDFSGKDYGTIGVECEDFGVSVDVAKILFKHGLTEDVVDIELEKEETFEDFINSPEDNFCFEITEETMVNLIIWYIKYSRPEAIVNIVKQKSYPAFNGCWGDLNVSIGYGLFYI